MNTGYAFTASTAAAVAEPARTLAGKSAAFARTNRAARRTAAASARCASDSKVNSPLAHALLDHRSLAVRHHARGRIDPAVVVTAGLRAVSIDAALAFIHERAATILPESHQPALTRTRAAEKERLGHLGSRANIFGAKRNGIGRHAAADAVAAGNIRITFAAQDSAHRGQPLAKGSGVDRLCFGIGHRALQAACCRVARTTSMIAVP
jgi:hypothetical protein